MFKKKLSALIEVRKIIAFIIVLVFVVLSLTNVLETNFVQNVILMVLAFYFAKSTALDGNDK